MKRFAQRIFLAFAFMGLWAPAQAQSFPTGPVNIMVPLAAGDAADTTARALGEEISNLLKTPVLTVNRPGTDAAADDGDVGPRCHINAFKIVSIGHCAFTRVTREFWNPSIC